MSNTTKYIALSESFTDLLDEIKARTAGGLSLTSLQDNQLIVRQGSSLQSVGTPKNVAPRDLYTGSSMPLNTLGKDGDLYFRTHVADERPFAHASWSQGVTGGTTTILTASNTNKMMRSTDGGDSWEEVVAPGWSHIADIATNGSGVFVAVGYDGDILRSTDDGVTWELVITLEVPDNKNWARYHAISYGNGSFIASRQLQNAISSDDGATWTIHDAPTESTPNDTTYGASGGWVTSYFNADYVMQSHDNVTWTKRMLPLVGRWDALSGFNTPMDWARVGYFDGRYVIPAWSSDVAVWSDDGVTWHGAKLPAVANWSRSAYGEGVVAISANSGDTLAVSFDRGKSWSSYILNSPGNWVSIIYVDGKFILTEDMVSTNTANSGRQLIIKVTDLFTTPEKVSIGGGDYTGPLDPLDPFPEPDPEDPPPEPAPLPVHPDKAEGNYCKTPNTDLAQLVVFFSTIGVSPSTSPLLVYDTVEPVYTTGTLWQKPTGAMSLRVYRTGRVTMTGTKEDMSRIGIMKGGFATVTLRNNQCKSIISRTIIVPTWEESGEADIVTLDVEFPELNGERIIDEHQRYVLEME